MPRITPFLWFDNNADEAIDFYLSVFKDSKRLDVRPSGEASKGPVVTRAFELDGRRFIAFNGGPHFKFNEAISFVVDCEDQKEIDFYWNAFIAGGGSESRCGWLKDKFGVSWQIVPKNIAELLSRSGAMQAMMSMKKLDIAALKAAAQ
jgi:predicted 3-demethylubiquinone-9 3-methyltransferase (glyoxalase superfamily)